MHSGNLVFILHTHLPWVFNHGKAPHGEAWLFEAVAECYIPLLNVFNELNAEGINPGVTLDISPILCEQLEHPDFKNRFRNYCDSMAAAAVKDRKNFKSWGYSEHHIWLTKYWEDWYKSRLDDFEKKYGHSVIKGLKELQDNGAIEIMTCGATHGYMPLLGYDRSINLQIKVAIENYKKHFGREPKGIWLPECAYRPAYEWHSMIPVAPFNQKQLRAGIEQFLALHGIEYFVTDQDLIERINPVGKYIDDNKDKFVHTDNPDINNFQPDFTPTPLNIFNISSGNPDYGTAAVFTRHRDIAMQVWSGEVGYPGEPDYLDFHKKHLDSMLRYWRVTDNKADMMYKTLYHPDWTEDKTELQANHFIHHIENTLNWNKNKYGSPATLCAPFDTELFGHWWFEGPEFLKKVIKGLYHSPYVNTVSASNQLYNINPREIVTMPEGSWGENNNHDVWMNENNKWTWEAIYNSELRLHKIFEKIDIPKGMLKRVMLQAVRELMLMHSSDWQFLIHTIAAKDYAEQRFYFHTNDFNRLCDIIDILLEGKDLTNEQLSFIDKTEKLNPVFPELELGWWQDPFK